MGEESRLEGGLNYELNVGGNFEQVLQRFETKIAELETRAKSLGKSSGLTNAAARVNGGAGGKGVKTDVTDGRALEVIKKRLLQLEDRLTLAKSNQIKQQRIITELEERLQNVQVKSSVIQNELARADVIRQRASEKNLTAQQKLLDKTEQIDQARKKGATTKDTIAQATGLSDREVAKIDKQVAAQDEAVKKQQEMAKAQMEQAKNANAQYVKDEKAAIDNRSKQWQAYFSKQEEQIAVQDKRRKETTKQESIEREANLKEQNKLAEATRKQAAEQEKLTRKKAEIVEYSRKHNVSEVAAARALGVSAAQARKLGFELSQAQQFAQNFFFTFRRLVGILAIFTLARQFANFLGQGVTEMSRFNGVLEQTRLSFASIIASVGDVANINGDLYKGVDKYNASLTIADRLTQEIRKDALNTVATFEELLGAFQAGIAPGLQAGLDIKQVEKVTVAMVKAASVMGVSGDKFAEEIRSVLSGTGSIRNTRLYQIMDKSEIQRAKEQGKLYDYLTSKLEPFNIASERVSQSWQGLVSNLKDATQNLLASGGVEYFDTLKQSIANLLNTMVDMDKLKAGFDLKDVLNKDALGAVEEVSAGLSDLIKSFGGVATVEDAFKGLRSVLAAVAEVMKIVGSAFAVIVAGIGQGISIFSAFIALALKFGEAMISIIPQPLIDGIKTILETLLTIITISTMWGLLVRGLSIAYETIRKLVMGIRIIEVAIAEITAGWALYTNLVAGGMTKIAAIAAVLQLSFGWIGLIVAALAAVIGIILFKTGVISKMFDLMNGKVDEVKQTWEEVAKKLNDATVAVGAQSEAVRALEDSWKRVTDRIDDLINKLKSEVILSGIRGEARQIFSAFSEGNVGLLKQMRDANKEMANIDAEIDRRRSKRNSKDVDDAKKFKNLVDDREAAIMRLSSIEATKRMRVNPNPFKNEPSRANAQDKKDVSTIFAPMPSKEEVDRTAAILKDEAELVALEKSREEAAKKIAEIKAKLMEIISQEVQLAKVELDYRRDGIDIINKSYDIQKARQDELAILQNDTLAKYIAQRTEIQRLQDLMGREAQLRKEAQDNENILIGQAIESGAAQEEINALKAAQTIHEQEYNEKQSRSQANVDGLIRSQELLNQELENQKNTCDSINIRLDLAAALTAEIYRRSSDSVKALAEQVVETARMQALLQQNQVLRDQQIANAQRSVDKAREQGLAQDVINKLEQDRINKIKDATTQTEVEASILRKMKADLEDMAKLVNTKGLASIGVGFKEGARAFVDEAQPMAVQFADAMRDALNDVVREAAASITDAIDPRKEAKPANEIAADAIMGLAQAMIQTVLQQFAVNMLTYLFGFQAATAVNTTALGVNTAALSTNTGAMAALIGALTGDSATTVANTIATSTNAVSTTANTAATAANTGASAANTGGLFAMLGGLISNTVAVIGNTIAFIANTAMLIGQIIANIAALAFNSICLLINAAIPGQTGGQVGSNKFGAKVLGLPGGYNMGGWVRGYARGGNVANHPRPSYISPRDTVPAWLQPKEYVMPVRRVDEWGVGFFEAIRQGRITPPMLGITPNMGNNLLSSRAKNFKGVYGFAEGGSVPRPSVASAGSRGGSSTQILPVVVATNNTVDQMLSGGRKSFNRKVNEASGRDRNASDTWR